MMQFPTGRKVLYLSVVLVALAALVLIVGTAKQQEASRPYSGPIEKIVIGNIGEFSIFNLIAQEKGYFTKYGLDAEILEYDAGPAAIADLIAGKTDVAVAADFVGVRNMFTNNDLRIVTQVSKHQVFQLLARKDKGIVLPADLRGHRIGVTLKSAGEFYLARFLTFQDLGMDDVVVVDLPPAQIVAQLTAGDIDAAVIFDPHAYNLKKQLGESLIEWSAQREQKTFALTYTTDTFTKAHPEIIERYVRALVEAEEFTKTHPDETKSIIAQLLKYDPAYVEHMWGHFIFAHALDQELLLTMEDQSRWVIASKLTKQTVVPNYLDRIYFDALHEVKPESITIIR